MDGILMRPESTELMPGGGGWGGIDQSDLLGEQAL